MTKQFCEGFEPFWAPDSAVLILGSFPSVKSRREGFYYGNKQNRFWRTVSAFFGEETPMTVSDKRAFLMRRKIALWDVVTACEIEGSSDSSITNEKIADLPALLKECAVKAVLCNGATAFRLLEKNFPDLALKAKKLPSTSPANPRFSRECWFDALKEVFHS